MARMACRRDLLSENLLSEGLVIGRGDVGRILETSFVARSRDEVHVGESRTTVVSSPNTVEDHEAREEGLREGRSELRGENSRNFRKVLTIGKYDVTNVLESNPTLCI